MKFTKLRLTLIAILASSGIASAASNGAVTGISASKTTAYVDEDITITVQGTVQPGKACRLYGGPGPGPVFKDLGLVTSFPFTFTTKPSKNSTTGKQAIFAYGGTADAANECTGSKTVEVTVLPKPVAQPAGGMVVAQAPMIQFQQLSCPGGYEKVSADNPKGEIKCRKLPAACPTHFDGSVDSATGKLVCTPKAAQCPEGWQGGMQGGILNCTSTPQPTLACPNKTPQWQWGTAYYKEGWRFMGCSANLEPAK
jgi:hypothetical protein